MTDEADLPVEHYVRGRLSWVMVGAPTGCDGAGVKEREELKRVERFDELAEWMLVKCGPCPNCKAMHRYMLQGKIFGPTAARLAGEWMFGVTPGRSCSTGGKIHIGQSTVELGRVFRVITGNDDEAEQREGRDLSIRVPSKVRA